VVLPRVVVRLVAGSAGLSMLLAPVAAGAQQAPSTPPSSPSTSALPAPTWPSSAPANGPSGPTAPAATRAMPGPIWPSAPASTPPAEPGTTRTTPPTGPPTDADRVRVAPGDSLWLVAARRLGPGATTAQISAAWPRWYAANRDVIGDDPALITPGLVLRVPAPTRQETP
jgi:resuscitation-promoting factor RpfA